jgi:hypothetical protein
MQERIAARMINGNTRAAFATAHRIRLEVIVIDLALRFPQDGLKVACRGQLGEPLQSHSWLGSCAKTQRSAAGFRAGK